MSATDDIDKARKVDGEDDGGSEQEEKEPEHEFSWYLKHEVTYKIVSTRWGIFTLLGGVVYAYHLTLTIAGVNNYADITRITKCGMAKNDEQASAVFDIPIMLPVIFHMLEWLRWCAFLTTALVNVNLIPLFYALMLNIPFGVIAMIVSIGGRFTGDGNSCAQEDTQAERARYCILQLLCLLLSPLMCFANVIFMRIKGVSTIHEWYLEEDDDDDD